MLSGLRIWDAKSQKSNRGTHEQAWHDVCGWDIEPLNADDLEAALKLWEFGKAMHAAACTKNYMEHSKVIWRAKFFFESFWLEPRYFGFH